MLKKYNEALSKKESETPDSTRGCNVFKVLKDDDSNYYDDYGEPAKEPKGYFKRKKRKGEKPDVAEYHKLHLFNEGLPSKDTQYDYTKDVEEKAKQEVAERDRATAAGDLEGTSTARGASVQDTTTGDEESVQQRTSGGKPVQDTTAAGTQPVQETTTADKKPVPQTTTTDKKPGPQTTTTDEEPGTDDADREKDMIESYTQDRFRDAVRRIDMVLVAVDDDDVPVHELVTFYLQNVLKAGLHIETSPGVMPMHRNLMFIKIHAPDSVLDEHNHGFGTKKYFRDDHLRFIQPGLSYYGRLLPCARVTHERELISLVRDQYEEPLRLSNEERSLIVYKILLQLPFGHSVNMIGLNKLLERRILLDAYALHDGPHFIPRNQDPNTISARQMLFYNWVGKINAYKVHPLSLIREYFGQRIGMFFAFYEFYNHALMIAALFGAIYFFISVNDTGDNYIVNDICKTKTEFMCPRCNVFAACRFSLLSNFCKLAKIHKVLDGPYVLHYGVFLAVWATTFYVLWKRKESFWKWLWEINSDQVHETFRPEYSMEYTIKPRSQRTGVVQNYTTGFEKYGRALVVIVLCGAMYGAPLRMLVPLFDHKQQTDINLMKDKVVSQRNEDIAFIVIFAIKLVIIQIICELIYRIPVHYITKLVENHRTYESYARSFAVKTFLASFMLTFPILFYYAWVKGLEYYLPVRLESFAKREVFLERRGQFSFTHCGPFTCLDEVFFVLLATILIKYMAIPFAVYLKGLIMNPLTDYNQSAVITKDAPSWEREYRLEPVTEAMMARKLTVLMMQFALVTLVGVVFPLAPLLLLIRNFCDIRYEARMFVQCRRRPLLLGAALGVWTPVLQHLALLSVPSIALTLARATKAVPRKMYMDRKGSMKGYLFYSMYRMSTKAYYYFNSTSYDVHYPYKSMQEYLRNYSIHNVVPKFCYTPGLFEAYNYTQASAWGRTEQQKIYIGFTYVVNPLVLKQEYHIVSFGKYYLYFLFSVAGLLYAALLGAAFPAYSREVNEIMDIERKLKKTYVRTSKKSDKAEQ